jgi:hypothetical protein
MICNCVGKWLIRRKDIQHHGVGYTSSATRFGLALSHDIRSYDLQPLVNIIPTVKEDINKDKEKLVSNITIYYTCIKVLLG